MLLFLSSTTQLVSAQGEHNRRAAAELQVILGDVRKLGLLSVKDNTARQVKGLEDRIYGGLSGLELLFRLADQESSRTPGNYIEDISSARELVNQQQLLALENQLISFENQFKLLIPNITVDEKAVQHASKLHQDLCAVCHDNATADIERPAYNLYQQAATESDLEFFARLLVGVRGDRVTGIDNPLSDIELMALVTLYKRGSPLQD